MTDVAFTPREVCPRCLRPASVCWCPHVTRIETKTRVVVLQHPRERYVPIGTARMAAMCLPRSELHVGVRWDDAALAKVLGDARDAVLLYPSDGATDVLSEPPRGPVTLVVVDGTWSQARKVVQRSPALARLPRYAFVAPSPSEYTIRREPDAAYVSTIEAVAYALGALEGDPARFEALLAPFRAMVATQLAYATREGAPRTRHAKKQRKPRVAPAVWAARAASLVCVATESNAWPHGSPQRPTGHPGELVHVVAQRVATGEVLDAVVAPLGEFAPSTEAHSEVPRERLRAGMSLDAFREAWSRFVRADDVPCSWSPFAEDLLAAAGVTCTEPWLDARTVARTLSRGRTGSLETFHATLPERTPPRAAGRAGRRAAALCDVARSFARRT